MQKIIIFLLIYLSSATGNSPFGNQNQTKIKDKSGIGRIRCIDKDLQRTLTWKPMNLTDDFQFLHYRVQFCPIAFCGKSDEYKAVQCYKDESRTRIIKRLKTNKCKTSVRQLDSWPYDYFRITGVYQDKQNDKHMKKRWAGSCKPIDQTTKLSALTMSIFSTKTSLKIHVEFNQNFQRTLNGLLEIGSNLEVTYFYCLNETKATKNERNNFTNFCKQGSNPDEVFEGLDSGSGYEVDAWYVLSSDFSVKSEVSKKTVRTVADPFPVRAQIATILSSSSFLLLIILVSISSVNILKFWKRMDEINRRSIPNCLKKLEQELECEAKFDYANFESLLNYRFWDLLQSQEYYCIENNCELIQYTGHAGVFTEADTAQFGELMQENNMPMEESSGISRAISIKDNETVTHEVVGNRGHLQKNGIYESSSITPSISQDLDPITSCNEISPYIFKLQYCHGQGYSNSSFSSEEGIQ